MIQTYFPRYESKRYEIQVPVKMSVATKYHYVFRTKVRLLAGKEWYETEYYRTHEDWKDLDHDKLTQWLNACLEDCYRMQQLGKPYGDLFVKCINQQSEEDRMRDTLLP